MSDREVEVVLAIKLVGLPKLWTVSNEICLT